MKQRYYTTAEVSAELGRAPSTVRQLAATHRLGECVEGRVWRFTRADIEALRGLKPGRPHKSPAAGQSDCGAGLVVIEVRDE
jgi:hypothetical protein